MRKLTALSVAALAIVMAGPATASITFTGTNVPLGLAASATFNDSVAGFLTVTLTNTSAADVNDPADVLTALFFSLGTNPALTRVSGTLHSGSTVLYDPQGQPAGGVIGGEWAYKAGLAAPGGATSGISSSGFNLFGPGDVFPGADLEPPAEPDGVQYGLLSAGDNAATGNGGITGSGGLIKNSVDFVFSYTGTLNLANISNLSFQYGTALTEPNVPGGPPRQEIPEPASIALVGLALLGLGSTRRRKT